MLKIGIVKNKKKLFNIHGERFERFIMSGIVNFFKDIFMILPEQDCVGLSGITSIKVSAKKVVKASKKGEPTLSELMKKGHKKLKV